MFEGQQKFIYKLKYFPKNIHKFFPQFSPVNFVGLRYTSFLLAHGKSMETTLKYLKCHLISQINSQHMMAFIFIWS